MGTATMCASAYTTVHSRLSDASAADATGSHERSLHMSTCGKR